MSKPEVRPNDHGLEYLRLEVARLEKMLKDSGGNVVRVEYVFTPGGASLVVTAPYCDGFDKLVARHIAAALWALDLPGLPGRGEE